MMKCIRETVDKPAEYQTREIDILILSLLPKKKTDVLKDLHASDGSTNIKPYAEYLLDQNNPWGTNAELLCKEDMRCNKTFSKIYSIDTCIKMVINMKYRHNLYHHIDLTQYHQFEMSNRFS